MALSAVIFDVDGTLIDSNPAHLQAWVRALEQHQYRVSTDRIAVEIGKGGDKLVPSIFGEQVESRDGKSLRERHIAPWPRRARRMNWKRLSEVLVWTGLRNLTLS